MIIRADEDIRKVIFSTEGKLAHIISYMPNWLKEALEVGSVIIVSQEEFSELDPEIKSHLEVLKQ